jgi:hypothetical protein
VFFLLHVVVVTVNRHHVGIKGLVDDLAQSTDGRLHHQLTVATGEILRPAHRLDIVVEVIGSLRQICQVRIYSATRPKPDASCSTPRVSAKAAAMTPTGYGNIWPDSA